MIAFRVAESHAVRCHDRKGASPRGSSETENMWPVGLTGLFESSDLAYSADRNVSVDRPAARVPTRR
jgi:hypothetical protein